MKNANSGVNMYTRHTMVHICTLSIRGTFCMDAWDDIQFLLALIRNGSVRGAAAALKVNHATVSRRMKALEHRFGSRLVQRTPDGYALTSDGQVIYDSGKKIEHELGIARQLVQGSDESVSGKVRITLTDVLLQLVSPALTTLLTEHPRLELETSVSAQLSDIARRNADIALRLTTQPPDDLVGKKLGKMPIAVYAAKSLGLDPNTVDLNTIAWIRWQEPWRQGNHETWPRNRYPEARVSVRVDSYAALEQMVALGIGVALLTPWSANYRDDLVQLTDTIDELGIDLWVLIHPDLRGVRRMKVVIDALAQEIDQLITHK